MGVESSNVGVVEDTVQDLEDGQKAFEARVQADSDSLWNWNACTRTNRIRDALGYGHFVARLLQLVN